MALQKVVTQIRRFFCAHINTQNSKHSWGSHLLLQRPRTTDRAAAPVSWALIRTRLESAPHLDAGYLAARAYPDGRSREEGSLSVNDSVCAWERREPAVALCGLQVFRMIPRETPISFCTPNRIRTCDLSLRRRTQ